jgi:FixJ family two-component response regulator
MVSVKVVGPSLLDTGSSEIFAHAIGDATPVDKESVFVIDDDPALRQALGGLIRSAGWRAETFASAPEFLSFPRSAGPCCLVLDLWLPGLNGLELQQHLAQRPDIPIIFVTGHGDVPTTVQAMKGGAFEFLTKPLNVDALLAAIQGAIESSRVALLVEAEMRTLKSNYELLSEREREVMALVVSGLLNKQVGYELGISEITVKAHRGRVMRKMKAKSFADLVTAAAKLQLVPVGCEFIAEQQRLAKTFADLSYI